MVKMLWQWQISNSWLILRIVRRSSCIPLIYFLAGYSLVAPGQVMVVDSSSDTNVAARANREFEEARSRFLTQTNSAEAAWLFGRACFDLAESATNDARKAETAGKGIAACRQAILRDRASAPGHYYLGVNLGQLADTKRNLAALKMVKEMEREFQAAADLDKQFDFAGPDRNLGLLYMQAPVLVSIGSRSKARQHLRQAVDLAPDYPENRLNLIEACLKWGDSSGARRECKALQEHWAEAYRKFAGETWAATWVDWEKRFQAAKRKLEQSSKPIESPRHED